MKSSRKDGCYSPGSKEDDPCPVYIRWDTYDIATVASSTKASADIIKQTMSRESSWAGEVVQRPAGFNRVDYWKEVPYLGDAPPCLSVIVYDEKTGAGSMVISNLRLEKGYEYRFIGDIGDERSWTLRKAEIDAKVSF